MAKEVKLAVDKHGKNLKHTQILDALAEGLGEKDFQALSKAAIPYEGIKSKKLYIDPEIRDIVKLETNREV